MNFEDFSGEFLNTVSSMRNTVDLKMCAPSYDGCAQIEPVSDFVLLACDFFKPFVFGFSHVFFADLLGFFKPFMLLDLDPFLVLRIG